MDKNSTYYRQVALLLRMIPIVDGEKGFALKGGTAINLFVRDFPRLSVDIDLAYLPMLPREEALENVRAALARICEQINALQDVNARLQDNRDDELRIVVTSAQATIKIEVSPVARGTLLEPAEMAVSEEVEEEFGFAEIAVVSLPDLYGGKICAAMDRQHPRDLFDVMQLLDEEGISRAVFVGFLTYCLGHPRPIREVMAPRWKELAESFETEFAGMTAEPIELARLEQTRGRMMDALQRHLTEKDKAFLLSFKQGTPDWTLFDYPDAAGLPAIRWKLRNIERLGRHKERHQSQIDALEAVLNQWLAKEDLGPK